MKGNKNARQIFIQFLPYILVPEDDWLNLLYSYEFKR